MTGGDKTVLPPLVLALQIGAVPAAEVVAYRSASGKIRAGMELWPSPVPAGALLLHWPARFRWSASSSRFAKAVMRADGAVFPLATVLGRLGISRGRGVRGLLAALAPELEEVADPALLGRRLLEGLAARLPEEESVPKAPRAPAPVRISLEALPAEPGTYTFLSADGRPLYLGKARSLKERVPRHFALHPTEPDKSRELVRRARELRWEIAGSELEALIREQLGLSRHRPPLNTQEKAHRRARGPWRERTVLLVLSSVARGHVEVCLLAGDGRFHWERVPRRFRVPRGLWSRIRRFLGGAVAGWGPGEPGRLLTEEEAVQLTEVALTWLSRHEDAVSRIDLAGETWGRPLMARIRTLLGEDPARGRIEAR